MTESENQHQNGQTTLNDVEKKIIRQVEYYFGDFNLARDEFLKKTIKENENGWVSMETMLKFQRLANISKDAAEIMSSLKKSDSGLLEIDEEKSQIRRNPEKPLPEGEGDANSVTQRSVYCKGFEKLKTSLDDLIAFFSPYDVVNVMRRTYLDKATKERHFKGSVFVTFKTSDAAKAFLELESVKNPEGEELIRKWQSDYNEEKKKEYDEKAQKIKDHKAKAKKVKEAVAQVPAIMLPSGACLKLENLNETTTRELIKEALSKSFVTAEDIAFVGYQKGEPAAVVRLRKEKAAVDLLAKVKEAGKLEINGAEVVPSVLEGEEETKYLDQCRADLKSHKSKGHKRRGGFQGGRGGKRHRSN